MRQEGAWTKPSRLAEQKAGREEIGGPGPAAKAPDGAGLGPLSVAYKFYIKIMQKKLIFYVDSRYALTRINLTLNIEERVFSLVARHRRHRRDPPG
jgi:hypothetical protein